MKTLAFIPARGGSKRIPGKNSRLLAGRPLIEWTIEVAKASAAFSEIVVSSDDDLILQLAAAAGVSADRRPSELTGDRVRFVEVLMEYLRRHQSRDLNAVAVLLPTCPFRQVADVLAVRDLFLQNPQASVVSISAYEFPPDFACDFDPATRQLELRRPDVYAHSTQSQSVRPAFHPNGSIYWASVARILETGSFFIGPIQGHEIPSLRCLDLDFPHQWLIAEALAPQLLTI